MSKLIQYCTKASLYDGIFGGDKGWPAAGMGYIAITEEKHIIVIDGGHREDAEALLELLSEQSGQDTPTVDFWIITHPHLDHYGALREIAAREDLRYKVFVKQVVAYFPDEFRDQVGRAVCYKANLHLSEIRNQLNTEIHVPVIGERMIVDHLALDFLFIPYDCTHLNNPNNLSLIFAIQGPRQRVLIPGDAYHMPLQYCVDHYGESLKADILQMPHHGLCDTGHEAFYRLVDASTLLIPISKSGARAMASDTYGDMPLVNRGAEERAQVIHYAFDGTVSLDI